MSEGNADFISVFLADAEVITGNTDGHWIAHRSNHFHLYRLARQATHLQQNQPEVRLFIVGKNHRLHSGAQLREPERLA